MKPEAIDNEMWDEIYGVYVKDKFNMNLRQYFEGENPAALQELTAVMMESARKGMWKASAEQLSDVAKLHTELVRDHGAACSGMVCDNVKLQQFISKNVDAQAAEQYKKQIRQVRQSQTVAQSDQKSVVMKREELNRGSMLRQTVSNIIVIIGVAAAAVLSVWMIRRRRHNRDME